MHRYPVESTEDGAWYAPYEVLPSGLRLPVSVSVTSVISVVRHPLAVQRQFPVDSSKTVPGKDLLDVEVRDLVREILGLDRDSGQEVGQGPTGRNAEFVLPSSLRMMIRPYGLDRSRGSRSLRLGSLHSLRVG
jgi:hypothetical protein